MSQSLDSRPMMRSRTHPPTRYDSNPAFLKLSETFDISGGIRYDMRESYQICPDGEMDITTDFGSVILGSNPGRGTGNKNGQHVIMLRGGYGLVVERVLAKDEAGVRFSLSAQRSARGFQTARPRFQFATARAIPAQKSATSAALLC